MVDNNKYGNIDELITEPEDKSSGKAASDQPARRRRPVPALAALTGDDAPISTTQKLRAEKEDVEKALKDATAKFEKEKTSLLEDIEKARSDGKEGAPIILTMPVTKQDVTFELKRIDPSLIDVSPENERIQEFLDEISLSDILPSVKKHGQQKPGTVRPKEGGRFELIEGSRRLASVKLAGKKYLALVGNVPEADVRELGVIENKHQDVSPYEKSIAFKRMIESGEFDSWRQLGAAKGISDSHILRYKACVNLDKLFVRILPSPSSMPLSYGETIGKLLKKEEKALIKQAKELLKNREKSLVNNGETLDTEDILKTLKSSVRTKTEAPKTWKPVTYKSADGKSSLKHAVTNKGATKFELVGVSDKDVESALQYLTKTLGLDNKK